MSPPIRFAVALLALMFVAPAKAQNPFASAGTPVVIGHAYDVPSQRLGLARRVSVMLPPDYAEARNRGTRYPVLYLLDRERAPHFTHIAGLVQHGSLAGATAPAILVAVESEDGRRELATDRSDDFRRFLTEELKPRIEAAYRTSGSDAVIGAGAAGQFVVETALRHGSAFDRYIAVSPSVGGDHDVSRNAARLLTSDNQAPRILWLTTGSEGGETQRGMDRLIAALRARTPGGMTWTYAPMPGETPASIFHPAAMRALRMLFPAGR
jgi:uncharacterized protein